MNPTRKQRLAPRSALLAAIFLIVAMLAAASCGGDDAPKPAQPTAAPPTAVAATAVASPTAAAVSPTAVAASPTAVAAVGKETKETLTVGGLQREAVVYVPAKLSAAKAPAILYLTAPGMQPQPLRARYGIGLDAQADRLGFIVVWPEGSTTATPPQGTNGATCCYWNNGNIQFGSQQPPDDIAFVKALLDLLIAKYPVDADRISFSGSAGGAVMTYRIACELSDRVAAFATVNTERDNTDCPGARGLSMLAMHGTANAASPYGGGIAVNGLPVPPVIDVIDYWRKLDACAGEGTVTKLTAVTEQRRYGPCKGGTEVVLITVTGGGNGWWGQSIQSVAAPGDPDLKASPIVAEFLIKQTRAGR